MLKTIEGIYRDGKVELLESPPDTGESRVVVTFMKTPTTVDLRQRGINERQAADLRTRLSAFHDDWNRPEMDIYDEE